MLKPIQLRKQELINFDSPTLLSLFISNIFKNCKSHKLSSALKHKSSIKLTAHTVKIPVSSTSPLTNDFKMIMFNDVVSYSSRSTQRTF